MSKIKPYKYAFPEITTFQGEIKTPDGKRHFIIRVTCNICEIVLSESHHNCCGYSSSGFTSLKAHKCKE